MAVTHDFLSTNVQQLPLIRSEDAHITTENDMQLLVEFDSALCPYHNITYMPFHLPESFFRIPSGVALSLHLSSSYYVQM